MRRKIKWLLIVLLVVAYPAVLVSRDCTTNRIALANDSGEPVQITVWIRDEKKQIWSGSLKSPIPIVVPFELQTNAGSLEIETRYADGRKARAKFGYIVELDGSIHLILVSKNDIHYIPYGGVLRPGWEENKYWSLFKLALSGLADRLTCIDAYLWRSVSK